MLETLADSSALLTIQVATTLFLGLSDSILRVDGQLEGPSKRCFSSLAFQEPSGGWETSSFLAESPHCPDVNRGLVNPVSSVVVSCRDHSLPRCVAAAAGTARWLQTLKATNTARLRTFQEQKAAEDKSTRR